MGFALHPHQEEALAAVLENYQRGIRRQLVSLPTGAGKTILATALHQHLALDRTVFMVHRDELVRQTVSAFDAALGGAVPIGIVKADRDETNAPIVVVSAQTVAREARLARLVSGLAGARILFISDEAHHDPAPSRRRAIEAVDPKLLVGLTATAGRADGLSLGSIYETIAHHTSLLDLILVKQLAPLVGLRIETTADLDAVHTRAGEFVEGELADAVNTPARNRLIVESWQRHATGRKCTVAFCVDVKHAEDLRDAFLAAGVTAAAILGTTPTEERQRMLIAFREGTLPVLTNCMVLSEGYDEPRIDCVLMARPTKSHTLYVQAVGRGARKAGGKADAIIIDFVDATRTHSLVTFPSLAGRDPADESRDAVDETDRETGTQVALLDLVQGKRALRERAARVVDLFAQAEHVWRTVGADVYYAPAGRGRWLVIVPREDGYLPAVLEQDGPYDPTHGRWLHSEPVELDLAMAAAAARIETNALTQRTAHWRESPASPAQLEFAAKLRLRAPPRATKGLVSGMIDDAIFGRTWQRVRVDSFSRYGKEEVTE